MMKDPLVKLAKFSVKETLPKSIAMPSPITPTPLMAASIAAKTKMTQKMPPTTKARFGSNIVKDALSPPSGFFRSIATVSRA
jgi:hypothetical protein